MKFGFFDDANKEYVINSPKTPYPWINYLGTQDFFSLISEIESEFNIHITELEIQRLVTVGDLLRILQEKGV